MADATSHQLARAIRDVGFQLPGPAAPPPPGFLVKFPTVAKHAVRVMHQSGPQSARAYLRSKLQGELNHSNPSMRGNATNTMQALENYIAADAADGKTFVGFGHPVICQLA